MQQFWSQTPQNTPISREYLYSTNDQALNYDVPNVSGDFPYFQHIFSEENQKTAHMYKTCVPSSGIEPEFRVFQTRAVTDLANLANLASNSSFLRSASGGTDLANLASNSLFLRSASGGTDLANLAQILRLNYTI